MQARPQRGEQIVDGRFPRIEAPRLRSRTRFVDDDERTRRIVGDAELIGGFAGIGAPDPDERNVRLYETVLSGDLAGNDAWWLQNIGENSFHVVSGSDSMAPVDGFTVTGGNADGAATPLDRGGGTFRCTRLVDCTLIANNARRGGAFFSDVPCITVDRCRFLSNRAFIAGGAALVTLQSADAEAMNDLFREKAFINGAKFVDTWNGFTDESGRYSAYGPDMAGQVKRLRADDGVHFTARGYLKLAHFVEKDLRRDLNLAKIERSNALGHIDDILDAVLLALRLELPLLRLQLLVVDVFADLAPELLDLRRASYETQV